MHPQKKKKEQPSEEVVQNGEQSQTVGGENGEKEEDSEEDENDAVWVLRQEGDLETFTNRGSVVIVYFYRNSKYNNEWQ